jgi:hypothetical protein
MPPKVLSGEAKNFYERVNNILAFNKERSIKP